MTLSERVSLFKMADERVNRKKYEQKDMNRFSISNTNCEKSVPVKQEPLEINLEQTDDVKYENAVDDVPVNPALQPSTSNIGQPGSVK